MSRIQRVIILYLMAVLDICHSALVVYQTIVDE